MSRLNAETLTIEGPDALAFAQAQFASDVRALAIGTWQWTAWLNAHGRVRALAQVWRPAEHQLRLLLRGGTAQAVAASLAPFVLRKRVALTACAPAALVDAPACPMGSVQVDGNDTTLGMGDYAMRITPTARDATPHWRTHAIRAGHPWLAAGTLDAILAPSLALQPLGAVSLGKGCFPGQEIVARMHYRGGGKLHLRCIESTHSLVPGSTLRLDGAPVGTILDSIAEGDHTLALAVVRMALPQGQLVVTLDGQPRHICTINVLR